MACSFMIEPMACGYHKQKSIWEIPVHDEELHCARDIHDPMAGAITKEIDGDIEIVYMCQEEFQLYALFLNQARASLQPAHTCS